MATEAVDALLLELAEALAGYSVMHPSHNADDLATRARAAAAELGASEKCHQGVLPMVVSRTGAPDEPVTEYIECSSISGGEDYVDGMPRCLTLHRVMEEGEAVGEIYADYVQVLRPEVPVRPQRKKPTREEAVATYSEVLAIHDCRTLGDMAEHFAHAILARFGGEGEP